MKGKTRTIPAGEFKAKCLALLDEVAATGEEIVVTKRGKPVARISQAEPRPSREDTKERLRAMIVHVGDVLTPLDDPWEADQ